MPLSLHPVPCWSLLCSSVAGSNPDLGWEGHARHPHVDHDKLDGRRGDSPVRPRTRVLRTCCGAKRELERGERRGPGQEARDEAAQEQGGGERVPTEEEGVHQVPRK
jgi:hypothetical protein